MCHTQNRGGHYRVKESIHSDGKTRRGPHCRGRASVSLDMIGGMVAAITFIVPHQTL